MENVHRPLTSAPIVHYPDAITLRSRVYDFLRLGKYAEACAHCIAAANHGDAEAQYLLGLTFKMGCDAGQFLPDTYYNEALRALYLASKSGHQQATFELGRYCYFQIQDYNEARHYFDMLDPLNAARNLELSSSQLAEANSCLGTIYCSNPSSQHDIDRGILHYTRGAELGDAHARFLLAYTELYICTPARTESGLEHLRQAAIQGHPEGQFAFGCHLAQEGRLDEATYCFQCAAELGHPTANQYLGNRFAIVDPSLAQGYYKHAIQLGCTESVELLKHLLQQYPQLETANGLPNWGSSYG